jgi:hypothetical protein
VTSRAASTALGTTLSGTFDPPTQPSSDTDAEKPAKLETIGFTYQKVIWTN